MRKVNGRMSALKRQEELQETEERIEKSHRKGQKGISLEHM